MSIYDELATAIGNHVQEVRKSDPKTERGKLGYTINGTYSVTSDDPMRYYVRFQDGFFVKADHNGKVAPIPDLPVLVLDARGKKPQIFDVDKDVIRSFAGSFSANVQVGKHTHERFSGIEFDEDLRLIKQLGARISVDNDLVLSFNSGVYFSGGLLKWMAQEEIDLTDVIGAISADSQCWIIVGIDTDTSELSYLVGAEISDAATLDEASLADITLGTLIPLVAIRAYSGMTAYQEKDFESLGTIYPPLSSGIAGIEVTEVDTAPDVTGVTKLIFSNGSLTDNGDGSVTIAIPSTYTFNVTGDTGTPQAIDSGNTLTISGGTGLSSVAGATDTVTINLDNTAVTPGSYTYTSLTVDAQGRITAASNGTTPMTSFTLAGDGGTPQSITDGNTLTISGGTGLTATAVATDKVTLDLDNTAVTPGSYTNTNLTVDAQGRITAAASGSPGSLSITETEVDFGSTIGYEQLSFTITDAGVSGTSKILAWQSMSTPTGKDADEIEADPLICRCLPGSGSFTLWVTALNGPVKNKFKIYYSVQ